MSFAKVSKLSLVVYMSKTKLDKNGEAPIYLRITLDKQRIEINLRRKVSPNEWDSVKCRVKGRDQKSKNINSFIDSIVGRTITVYEELTRKYSQISPETLKQHILGKDSDKIPSVLESFDILINDMTCKLGIDFKKRSIEMYQICKRKLAYYFKNKLKKSDVEWHSVNDSFIEQFENYMKIECKLGRNTVVGVFKRFRRVAYVMYKKGYLDKNPFEHYSYTFEVKDRTFLLMDEIEMLKNVNLEMYSENVQLARDLYLFSCFTGLAFVDVMKLTPSDLEFGNVFWIKTRREKTNSQSYIPLLEYPKTILEKYMVNPDKYSTLPIFPQMYNTHVNKLVRVAAEACGLKKKFSFHSARHSFATTVTLTNGVPLETVSKMLGHSSLRTTQHYAKIVGSKIESDMLNLAQRLNTNLATTTELKTI